MSSHSVPDRPAMAISVNGETRELPTGYTVGALLRDLGLDPHLVVVERNRAILRDQSTFDEVTLHDNDVLELVHFVGGG